MSVSVQVPSRRRVGTGFQAVGALVGIVIAIGALLGVAHQGRELSGVQRTAVAAQSAAIANERGLRKANARLEAAGEKPVPIPSPGPSGAAGAAGANGQAGQPGPTGASGQGGSDGAAGASGATGPVGPAGAAGADGKDGAAGSSSEGAPGAAGSAGPAGADGADGSDGRDGDDGSDGQPPQSWTYDDALGVTYSCTRTDPFDPGAPTYDCAPATP